MDTGSFEAPQEQDQPASLVVELMLSDFDELIEIDYIHGRMRNLKHTEGKLFAPVIDSTIRDVRRYSAEHMIHPDDLERYLYESDPETAAERLAKGKDGARRARFRFRQLGGGWRWMEQVAISGKENGMPEGICYIFLFDVQEQVEREGGEASAPALCNVRNELTGLLVEDAFFSRAKGMIAEHNKGWCVVAIDLERFKLFNEWYGRKHGDLLLAQAGAKLTRVEESSGGIACYFGQDDFALMVPYDMEQIEALYNEIHELIKEYGTSVGFMPAFGIAMVDGGSTIEELYDRASLASRYAKENFHTRIRTFEPSMYQQTERDYQILSDFQTALQNHELFIQLQPQCKISTKRIVGAESLVRWRRPNGELVSPSVFVPVLERYGFVTDLDKYVWEEVAAWQKKWIEGGHTPLPVSVNVSQIDIFTIDVPQFFEDLVQQYGLPVDVIKVEITESAYADNEAVADTVRRLRKKGFLVLMDDFGSGYSSLNMLRNLNVDIIKLDAQFLRMDREDRRKGLQIMESIVNLAKTMSVPIIVEGVETRQEADFLSGLGCRYVQGYYFYRPMPVADFEELIADPQNIDTRGFLFKVKEQFHTREFLDENVFSDTMLNNILGPVAFFLLSGKTVDIVRYNQQFFDEVKTPQFTDRLNGIQRQVLEEDLPVLYELFDRAEKNPLGGANATIRLRRSDDRVIQLQLQFFFLEEDESGKRFYGSVHDVTRVRRLSSEMQLLSRLSPDSIVFLRPDGGGWNAQVVIHGLEHAIGIERDEFELALNDGRFFERIVEKDRDWLRKLLKDSNMQLEAFSPPFSFQCANGGTVTLRVGIDDVQEQDTGVKYLVIFRQVFDPPA